MKSAKKAEPKRQECVCKGACPCHTGIQLLGVPCPPDCPNVGTRFDGCHRCDCGNKEH